MRDAIRTNNIDVSSDIVLNFGSRHIVIPSITVNRDIGMLFDQSSHNKNYGKAFAIGIALNILYVVVEFSYGIIIDSSALLADAGHNVSDVLSLIFAWFARAVALKKPSLKYTFGLRRSTILVAILNALLLFAAAGVIGWNAWQKFFVAQKIPGTSMMIVAAVGIVINAATALLFIQGQKADLNIKGAFLHMAADAGISAGVFISGFFIEVSGETWIDPVPSFAILVVIVYSTWNLFSDALNLALDAVPKDIDYNEVRKFLENQSTVKSIHDLHIWAMSTNENALSVHLVVNNNTNTDSLLQELKRDLSKTFDVTHTTIQFENIDLKDQLPQK